MDNSKNEMTLDFTNGETATLEFSDTDINFKECDPDKVNVIESISVNDDELEVSPGKNVNIKVTSGKENGSISVNDKDVKVTGLGSAAYLNEEDLNINVDISGEVKAAIDELDLGTASKSNVEDFEAAGSIDKAIENLNLGTASEADVNDFEKAGSVKSAIDGLSLGSAAFMESENFDASGAAQTVQDNLDVVEGRVTTLECKEVGDENTIESISVNGTPQTIDENKNVDITVAGGDSYWEDATITKDKFEQVVYGYYGTGYNAKSLESIKIGGKTYSGSSYYCCVLNEPLIFPDEDNYDIHLEIQIDNTVKKYDLKYFEGDNFVIQTVTSSSSYQTRDGSKNTPLEEQTPDWHEVIARTGSSYALNCYGYGLSDDGIPVAFVGEFSNHYLTPNKRVVVRLSYSVAKTEDVLVTKDNLQILDLLSLKNDNAVKLQETFAQNYFDSILLKQPLFLYTNQSSGTSGTTFYRNDYLRFMSGTTNGTFKVGNFTVPIKGLDTAAYHPESYFTTATNFEELEGRVDDLENAPVPVIPEVPDYWNVTVETGENQTASNTYSGRCSEPFFGEIILFGQDWQMRQLFGQAQLSEPLPLLDVDEQTVTMTLRAKDIYDETWTYNETFTGTYHKDDNDIIWNRETKEQVIDSMDAASGLNNEFGYVANAEGNPYLIFSGVLSSLPFDYEIEFSTVAVGESTNRLTPKDTYAIQPLKIITSSGEFIYDGTKPVTIDLT